MSAILKVMLMTQHLRFIKKIRRVEQSLVYVGANDGMLHAFDALTGAIKFLYMPM